MDENKNNGSVSAEQTEITAAPAQPKRKGRSAANKIIMFISVVVLIVAGSVCIKYTADIIKSRRAAEEIAGLTNPALPMDEADYGDVEFPQGIQEKYKRAYAVNNELVGWIKVPGTAINHPVVHTGNNEYYLRRNFYKSYERRGTLFADYRNNITADGFDANTIIYGHNYLDSTMFSDLENYKDIAFWKENPVIEFNTIYRDYKWKIIAVFLTNADEADNNGYVFNYIYPFMSGENYAEYFAEIEKRSLYTTGIDVDTSDKILTLSTCTRDMDVSRRRETNARCVVVARLVRDGESEMVDTSLAVQNESPMYPQIWYDKNGLSNPYRNAEKWYPKGVSS